METEPAVSWSANPTFDDRPTDLKLQLDHGCFYVHRDVLERSCDYFKAMFNSSMIEQTQEVIQLHDVNYLSFMFLVKAFYTDSLQCERDLEELFLVAETAHMLQVNQSLHNQCLEYFKDIITSENCFLIMKFADEFGIQDIYNYARRFCLAYFIDLRYESSFLEMTESQLINYLSDDNLCIDHEAEVLEAVRVWLNANSSSSACTTDELLCSCVRLKNNMKARAIAKQAVMNTKEEMFEDGVPDIFISRSGAKDILMFWSLLTSTKATGLVDVVRLCTETSTGVHHDSMDPVLEQPGYDIGSAVCTRGPYVYISGGGPGFGKVNWIRKIWRFDSCWKTERWKEVGELTETRRHHAMVALGQQLYLFGGFGKFRMRNSNLDCFNPITGTWQRLSQMPTHTISPVTTTHHHKLFYIDSTWNIHAFNSYTSEWTTVNHSVPLTSMPASPAAMHFTPSQEGESEQLFVVSKDEGIWSVCEMHWTSEPGTMIPSNVRIWDCEETLRHCILHDGKLVVFFEKKDDGEKEENEENGSIIWKLKTFEPLQKVRQANDWLSVRNIRKAQNVVSVPSIPYSFQISQ